MLPSATEQAIEYNFLIECLSGDRSYFDSGQSQWIPVRADEVTRWLVAEDTGDVPAWEQRVREWAAQQLAERLSKKE